MDLSNGAQYTETCSYNTDWSGIVHVHMGQLLLIKQNLKHVSHIPAAVFLRQMTSVRLAKGERPYTLDRLNTHGMIFDYN